MGRAIEPRAEALSPAAAGFRQRCPSCNKGKLFCGLLSLHETCQNCGLSLKKGEGSGGGDGPIFLVITFFGMLVTALAGLVEYRYSPPLWLHAAMWIPLILLGSIYFLRFFKSMMICVEYKHRLRGFEHE